MKEWSSPRIESIEEDLKKLIVKGACSLFCMVVWDAPTQEKKLQT